LSDPGAQLKNRFFFLDFPNKLLVNFLITLKQNYWEKVGNCEIISGFFVRKKRVKKIKKMGGKQK